MRIRMLCCLMILKERIPGLDGPAIYREFHQMRTGHEPVENHPQVFFNRCCPFVEYIEVTGIVDICSFDYSVQFLPNDHRPGISDFSFEMLRLRSTGLEYSP